KRRLAYEIGGHTEGYYVLIKFQGNPAAAIELDRILRITDPVMRHLIVREYTGRRKSAAAAAQAPAAPATEVAGTAAEAEAEAGAEAGESTGGTGSGAQSKQDRAAGPATVSGCRTGQWPWPAAVDAGEGTCLLNRVILTGRLAADPELRYTQAGVAVTNFRIAVDRPFSNLQGERETDFFPVVTWRKLAE